MGIYISGVKGLPEQVQENKNKIKEVEEQIEGIDFEAIRQLENQVAENTQDINNLEASIGVQNQAINTLNNDVDALESKTQKITYDEDTGKTTIDSYTIINGDLDTDNVAVAGNGTFQNANGSGLHFQEGANDDEVVLSNRESGTAHYLTLHADGTLTLDGGPVGGSTLYQHNIVINYANNAHLTATLYTSSNVPFTKATLTTFLNNNGIELPASGGALDANSVLCFASSILYFNGHITCFAFSVGTSYSIKYIDISLSAFTYTDSVIQIA